MFKKLVLLRAFLPILIVVAVSTSDVHTLLGQASGDAVQILDVAWRPDGHVYATLDNQGNLTVIDPRQNAPVFQFAAATSLHTATAVWSSEGFRLAAGIGHYVYIWNTTTWQLSNQFIAGEADTLFATRDVLSGTSEGIASITWSNDDRYIISGSLSYLTTVWNDEDNRIVYQAYDLSSGGPGRVWLNNDGWMSNGTSKLNAVTGEYFRPTRSENPNAFFASAEDASTEPRPDNRQIAWGTVHGQLYIINLETLTLEQAVPVRYNADPYSQRLGIADISWNGTWNFIAVAFRDGDLYVVNLVTGEAAAVLSIDGQLNAVDWNPRTNQVTYAGLSDEGASILATVDVSGIAGVPAMMPTATLTSHGYLD